MKAVKAAKKTQVLNIIKFLGDSITASQSLGYPQRFFGFNFSDGWVGAGGFTSAAITCYQTYKWTKRPRLKAAKTDRSQKNKKIAADLHCSFIYSKLEKIGHSSLRFLRIIRDTSQHKSPFMSLDRFSQVILKLRELSFFTRNPLGEKIKKAKKKRNLT